MKSFRIASTVLALFLLLAVAPAWAEKRVAFVVGNAAYTVSALSNPVSDANDVAAALTQLGFDVVKRTDVTLRNFDSAFEDFRIKARGADVALVYYAGHAMQFEQQNWLMPVDTDLASPTSLRRSNVSLQNLMRDLEGLTPTTLVFLDACRTNVAAQQFYETQKVEGRNYGAPRGMAAFEVSAPQTLVVFATKPNRIAYDGKGRNSPFTAAFLKHAKTPGVEIEVLMKRVAKTVFDTTDKQQEPERLSHLRTEFYFASLTAAEPPKNNSLLEQLKRMDAEAGGRVDFELAKSAGDASVWRALYCVSGNSEAAREWRRFHGENYIICKADESFSDNHNVVRTRFLSAKAAGSIDAWDAFLASEYGQIAFYKKLAEMERRKIKR